MSEEIAMNNPVIVFFDPTKTIGSWTCPVKDGFPIGWTQDGRMDTPAQSNQNYCVLLLDDTAEVPVVDHANKDHEGPLLIVPHNSSTVHRDTKSDSILKLWGRPFICPGFSHLVKDEICEEIMALFDRPQGAAGFAKKRLNVGYLGLLDNLAAICQMNMLDSNVSAATGNLMRELLGQLGLKFSNSFKAARTTNGNPDWSRRLAIIQENAATFAL